MKKPPIPRALKPPAFSFAYVYEGQACIGHIIARGKIGTEAFDTADRSLGVFKNRSEAADALSKIAGAP